MTEVKGSTPPSEPKGGDFASLGSGARLLESRVVGATQAGIRQLSRSSIPKVSGVVEAERRVNFSYPGTGG